jgi:hypothetical protein
MNGRNISKGTLRKMESFWVSANLHAHLIFTSSFWGMKNLTTKLQTDKLDIKTYREVILSSNLV